MVAGVEIPELDARGLSRFGLMTGGIIAGVFGLLLPWLLERPLPAWPWVVAVVLVAWSLCAPASLRPVYRTWMRFGLLAGRVMTPLILAAVFLLLITPVAILRRLLSGDPMPKRRDSLAETYRIGSRKREPEDLKRPF